MLAVKFILISTLLLFARAHVVMDDLEIMANPEFLAISSTHLNKTTSDITMSMEMEIKKDVKTVFSSVVLHCKIKGEYREIYRVIDELCSETKKDELIQYSINLIEQFGDLKISSCPIKMGHYTIRDLKLEDAEIMKSFGLGRFKAVVETYTIEDGENKPVMSFDFLFHGE